MDAVMKFQEGQVVEIKLKDGRKVKGEVGAMDQHGMVLWNVEVVNTDETVSNARIFAVAFQDIVEEAEKVETATSVEPTEAEAVVEPVERPRRRRKTT